MKKIFLLLTIILCCYGVSYAYDNTYAVIVGVKDYTYANPLRYSSINAMAIYNFLRSKEGGSVPAENICLLLDSQATSNNVIDKAKKLFAKAGKKDRVIFYFAGHGNRYGLAMYDNTLYYKDVKNFFRVAQCGTKLMFIDACHTGSVKSAQKVSVTRFNEKVNKIKGDTGKGNKNDMSNVNIVVMTAAKSEEVGWDTSEFEKTVFTHYLIKGLGGAANRDGNGYITIQELYYYVYQNVVDKTATFQTQQHPQLFGKFDLRLIVGNVYK